MVDNTPVDPIAEATAFLNSPEYRQRVADAFGVEYGGMKPTPPPAPLDPKAVTLPPAKPAIVTLSPGEIRPEEMQAALDDILQRGGGPGSLDGETAVKVVSGQIAITQEQVVKARKMLDNFKRDRGQQELFEKGDTEMRGWFETVTAVIAMGELKGW